MNEQTALVKPQQTSIVTNVTDLQTIAQVFVKSGFFQDTADVAKAQVKIMAGREIGLEPFASMSGIHVIKGKVTYGANIMAAKVKGSGRYDYRVREMTDKACRIVFYQLVGGKWEEIGPSDFTIEDARKAGTQNLDRFPRNMLFARAISNGVKWYCPDVTQGVTMYTPEEFGAVVDDSGVIVEVDGVVTESEPTPTPAPERKAPMPQPQSMTYEQAASRLTPAGTRYDNLTDEQLKTIIDGMSKAESKQAAFLVLKHDRRTIYHSAADYVVIPEGEDMPNDPDDGLPFGDK